MNRHGSCVLLGDCGVLIEGPSGAGKSTLALALVDRWRSRGAFACLVGDDQLLVREVGGRMVASVPPALAGLVEVHGFGIARTRHEPAAVIDLVVALVELGRIERMPAEALGTRGHIEAPARQAEIAARLIETALGGPA